jgi:hypothetical protein
MNVTRRASLALLAGASGLGAGCVGVSRDPRATVIDGTTGGDPDTRYVRGQPQLTDAPAVTAKLVTEARGFDRVFRVEHLPDPLRESISEKRNRFVEGETFLTVFAAALRFDYGLTDYENSRLEDETMNFFVEPVEASVGEAEDQSDPTYGYYYSFDLWKLRSGVDPPSDIELTFQTPTG